MLTDQCTLTISEAADALGCSASYLRIAERLGAIPPPRRTAGGHRRYTAADLERLSEIGIGQGLRKLRGPRGMAQ